MSGRRALAALAAVLVTACAGMDRAGDGLDAAAQERLAPEQEVSLDFVLYGGNPRPPAPSATERERARGRIAAAPRWEAELLRSLYPDDGALQTLAVRDTDGDGVPDFRISDYFGRFLEGDTDLDGDGADNLLDADPFDPARGAPATPGIPSQLSWEASGKPARMVRIQQELFERHGILLVERSADFTLELAQAVSDVVTRVFASTFASSSRLPTLRAVATAESSLLLADDEAGAGDFAQVFAATQTMEIYRRGIDAEPAIQLGFLAHEIGHTLQYAMDFDATERNEIVRRNYVAAPNFHALVGSFGWTRVPLAVDPESAYSLFRPQYIAEQPYDYRYRDESPAAWEAWLAEIYDEAGDAYLGDERVTRLHLLGDYSLSSPWEWYSDHLIAYLYLSMLHSLADTCAAESLERIAAALQDDIVAVEWPYFRFLNARGAPFQDYLREAHPIDPADARYLAETYLPPSLLDLCRPAPRR